MERDLDFFKTQMKERNLCREFAIQVAYSESDTAKLAELTMRADSVHYFANAIYEGWGVGFEYIKKTIPEYINTDEPLPYKHSKGIISCFSKIGVIPTYQFMLQHNDIKGFELKATTTHLCNCDMSSYVVKRGCTDVVITNKSDVVLDISELLYVSIYVHHDSNVVVMNAPKGCKITITDYTNTQNHISVENCEGEVKIKQERYDYAR